MTASAAPPGQAGVSVWADELTRQFGDRVAVSRLNFAAAPGTIFGIFGNNAAGKSTVLSLCAGLIAPTAGRVRVLGQDPSAPALARHVGYMGQQVPLYPDLTLMQNLRVWADARGIGRGDNQARFAELCERLEIDLHEAETQPSRRLSRGVQRRACLAFAFLHRPEVLLLDEPTSGMDERDQLRLWEILQEAAGAGTCIVLSSHHPEEAEYCERVLLLKSGRTVLSGTVPEIKARHVGGARVRIEAPRDAVFGPGVHGAPAAPGVFPGVSVDVAAASFGVQPRAGAGMQLVIDRLQGLGYRLEWSSRPDGPGTVRVFLDDYSEEPLRRLRALLETLPGSPAVRLDLPTMEQVFREALAAT